MACWVQFYSPNLYDWQVMRQWTSITRGNKKTAWCLRLLESSVLWLRCTNIEIGRLGREDCKYLRILYILHPAISLNSQSRLISTIPQGKVNMKQSLLWFLMRKIKVNENEMNRILLRNCSRNPHALSCLSILPCS